MNTSEETRFSKLLILSTLISFSLYCLTCFRTFTWWDSSEYSLASLTFGVPHPPGSLLTVLIGWIATKLPLGIDKFFTLNLLAALIAAITVYLVGFIAFRLYYQTEGIKISGPAKYCAFLGALMFGVSITTWYYAIRFTPYITTALMTACIILAMLAWQRNSFAPNAHLWLGLITLLFGLDFSIHRTNLLLFPAFLIWILIFRPRAFISVKNWIYAVIGLALGLAVQLITIPMAAGQPFINFNDPSSLSRFWDYITVKQYGGGWLINIFPRKAPFLSVQVTDYIKVFGSNFANGNWAYLGFLPFLLGLAGLIILYRRNLKLGLGLSVLFLFSSLGAILYFNLPQNFFRSIDRHYMPSFVILSIFVAYGAGVILYMLFNLKARIHIVAGTIALILITLLPIQTAINNYSKVDGSKSYFAYDTAKNFLNGLPQGAIIFTQADIDTYPLWCLQAAEKLRPDVTVCNLSLMNTPWFIEQILDKDKEFPVRMNEKEIASLSPIPWNDTTISLPVNVTRESFELSPETILPDSVNLVVPPTFQGKYVLVQDQMILKTIQANNWRRPICFSSMMPQSNLQWMMSNLRLEGLYWRLVPVKSSATDIDLLRKKLVDVYKYRGYADSSIPKDDPTKWVAWNYCSAFITLSSMQYGSGDSVGCRSTMDHLRKSISLPDLQPPAQLMGALDNACK